jgi:hypothetical protein
MQPKHYAMAGLNHVLQHLLRGTHIGHCTPYLLLINSSEFLHLMATLAAFD